MTVKGYEGPQNCIAADGTVGFEGPVPGMCSSRANLSLPPVPIGPRPSPSPPPPVPTLVVGVPDWMVWVGLTSGVLGAYHGYRRTESVVWAIGWSVFAGLLPFLAAPIALAQGFGKPEKRANPGRRRRGRRR